MLRRSMCMQSVGERPAISEREAFSSGERYAHTAHTPTQPTTGEIHGRRATTPRCCARHTVHGQSSPMACVRSDELIAQPACYWVTESHQDAPPAETPTASKPHLAEREKRPTNPDKRQGTIIFAETDNRSQTTHPLLDTRCSRLCPDLCAHARGEMRLASHAATSFRVTSHVHIPPRLFVLALMTQRCDFVGRTKLLIFFALFISPCTRELLG
jgi:hypothetical protein